MTEPAFQRDMRIGDRVRIKPDTGQYAGMEGRIVGIRNLDGYIVLIVGHGNQPFERRELERL